MAEEDDLWPIARQWAGERTPDHFDEVVLMARIEARCNVVQDDEPRRPP